MIKSYRRESLLEYVPHQTAYLNGIFIHEFGSFFLRCTHNSNGSGIIKGPFEWSLIFWVINPPDGYITKAQVRSCFAVRLLLLTTCNCEEMMTD